MCCGIFNRIILIFLNWGKKGQSCLHLKDLVVDCCFIFADLQLQLKRNIFCFHKYFFFHFFSCHFLEFLKHLQVSWTVMSKLPKLCFDRFLSVSYTQCHAFKSWLFFFNKHVRTCLKPNATAQYASLFHNMTFWNAKNRIKIM